MPAENAGRAFALVVVDELARRGVRHAVVAPGSRSTPIALALLEEPRITVHVRIDERSAAYLALGIAKASRSVVPVLCTSGTATSYFHGAVMEADLARVPLLVLTADRPPELRGTGANQTVDQVGLYGTAVRWAVEAAVPQPGPDSVAQWRELVANAVAHCAGAVAGPVHLNLPLREPLIPVDDGVGFPYELDLGVSAPPPATDPAPDDGPARRELAGLVAGAANGVVVAGGCGVDIADAVARFAERAGWPLIAEPHSNARRGPLAMRATDGLLRDPGFTGAHPPDLVLVVGRVGLSRALLDWLGGVRHVVLPADGGSWDVTRSAAAIVHCSADALAAIDVAPAEPAWTKGWLDAAGRLAEQVDAVLDESDQLTEPRVAREVAALLPDGAALVVGSSMPIRDLDLVMRPREGLRVLANRGVSGIDGFVSTVQGVAIGGQVDAPTVALCGDLSLLHDINGLLPGPDSRPDVTYVVINNDGGGIFSLLPQGAAVDHSAFERLFGTPHGMSIEGLAAAYDVDYTSASTAGELGAALSTHGGVRIVEVRTDRAANAALHGRLRELTPRTA